MLSDQQVVSMMQASASGGDIPGDLRDAAIVFIARGGKSRARLAAACEKRHLDPAPVIASPPEHVYEAIRDQLAIPLLRRLAEKAAKRS